MTHSSPQAESTVTWDKDCSAMLDTNSSDWTYQDISFIGNGIYDFFSNVSVFAGTLQIIPGISGVVHQRQEIVIHSDQLVVFALDVRHFHVVSGGADILELLS